MSGLVHPEQLRGHRLVVVGAGRSGVSAARLGLALGAQVRLLDRNPQAVDEATATQLKQSGAELLFGQHSPDQFQQANMVVLSPGIPLTKLEPHLPSERGFPVISELELASWFVEEPIIAVTGTNGKTTTVGLIHHLLTSSGQTAFLGGNIGTPLSDYLLGRERCQVLVLEVSSFQLQLCSSFHPRVGVLLNVSPNHLDYHADMEEYYRAKLKLFRRQTDNDVAVLPFALKEQLDTETWLRARRVYFVNRNAFHSPHLPGPHNQENMEAAYQACRAFGLTEQAAASYFPEYLPEPHRMQQVLEKDGVLYVDDSKSTTPASLAMALQSFERPILLLAGGRFKGGDLGQLKELVRSKVRAVGLFGESRELFSQAWQDACTMFWKPGLAEAVRELASMAKPGDVVLLSPATSSFDLFSDYKARGICFQETVREL